MLDFLELSFNMDGGVFESFFKQLSESEQDRRLNKYNGHPDKILKTEILDLKDNDQVTVALRQSGNLDFYWNMKRVFSSEDNDQTDLTVRINHINDFIVNFDELLIEAKTTSGTLCMAYSLNA